MSKIVQDPAGVQLQIFGASRIQAVTAATPWVPQANDIAFCVPVTATYTINGAGSSGTLPANAIRAIMKGQTYTFSATMDIEVM